MTRPTPLPPASVPHDFIERGGLGGGKLTKRYLNPTGDEMPPKEPPAETADAAVPSVANEELEAIRAEAYKRGYDDGYAAAKPKPGMFEAARLEAVRLPATLADNEALLTIDGIMERVSAEYGERFPRSDRELLFAAWARSTKQRERSQAFPPGQRVSKEPPSGPPNVEYELVT